MKRREFLRWLGIGAVAVVAAPKVVETAPAAPLPIAWDDIYAGPQDYFLDPKLLHEHPFQGYDYIPIVPQETVFDTKWEWKEYKREWSVRRKP